MQSSAYEQIRLNLKKKFITIKYKKKKCWRQDNTLGNTVSPLMKFVKGGI